ncbi:MAG: CBS domain-containing protein [Candidatus Micrarchaeota archaeon]
MLQELAHILRMRRSLGVTQKQLSKASGVSQSAIAKIESGKLDPSYSNAVKLFDALECMQKKGEKVAKDIMNQNVIVAKKDQRVIDAVKLLKEKGISQLPVSDAHGRLVGSISEKSVINKVDEGSFNIGRAKVFEIMDDPFPTVSEKTPVSVIAHILRDSLAIVVLKSNRIAGIITKSDMLKTV